MKIEQSIRPLARKEGLVVKDVGDEVLVYDLGRNKAHCLNRTAALVWQHADGRNDVNDIANLVSLDLNTTIDEKVVLYALSQLNNDHLLETAGAIPAAVRGLTRREAVRALGIAAVVAVPVVSSIIAPTPAQAATCLPTGSTCTSSAQCCSGLCNAGTCA